MQGVLNDGTALFLAENDTDGWVLVFLPHLAIQRSQVKLHLADELRQKLADFEFNGDKAPQATVKQQQVYEKFPAVHLQPVLAAHEGKHAAHGPQEVFDPGDQCPFQFPFAVFLAQLQKIEGIFVLYRQFGLSAEFRCQCLIEICLAEQRLLVALIFDLVNQHIF